MRQGGPHKAAVLIMTSGDSDRSVLGNKHSAQAHGPGFGDLDTGRLHHSSASLEPGACWVNWCSGSRIS